MTPHIATNCWLKTQEYWTTAYPNLCEGWRAWNSAISHPCERRPGVNTRDGTQQSRVTEILCIIEGIQAAWHVPKLEIASGARLIRMANRLCSVVAIEEFPSRNGPRNKEGVNGFGQADPLTPTSFRKLNTESYFQTGSEGNGLTFGAD